MRKFFGLSGLLAISLLVSCVQSQTDEDKNGYKVEITRTSYGIPHIVAEDFGSLGYGEGFAAAEDHVCNIAHGIVIARAERTKYHGNGEKDKHLLSDIVIRALEIPSRAVAEFAAQSEENREWIEGYAAGYNKYVVETGRDNITSWCKGAEWVKEVTAVDIFSRFQVIAQSAPRMAGMIVSAKPPKATKEKELSTLDIQQGTIEDEIDTLKSRYFGSNGWAFGKDRTENGRGLLLGNPHYPWSGVGRFWEKHLTIPGKYNVYGSSLIGAPGVNIGFNENVGWTHTVSNSERVVFYSLKLVAGDATSYYYDGKPRKMLARKVMIPQLDGTEAEHTVWFSHYGPMVSLPGAKWTDKIALTMRDANFRNQNLFAQWKDMGMSKNMDEFKAAHKKWNAMPWVNTMATSDDGRAVYIDGSNVGRLSEEAIELWRERTQSDPLTKTFHKRMQLILLDGSDSRFEWQQHPESIQIGVVPYSEKPQSDRSDYIFNANDSHWLTHVNEPLTGYSPLFGPEESPRTLRTRMNAKLVSDISENGPAGKDGKFSLKEMQRAIFSNRSLSAELLLDELVAVCTATTSIKVADQDVDLSNACAALKGYNKTLNLESKGAALFREWVTLYQYTESFKKGSLFAVAFDPNDPVNTPRGLADEKLALENLAKAAEVMKRANLKLDSALGEVQFAYRGGEKIAIHGGKNEEGIANIIGQRYYDTQVEQVRGTKIKGSKHLTDKGYPVTFGTSFILSLSYTDTGPVAEAFLSYSESGDPTSDHYSDQTHLFSAKQWRPVLFNAEDIKKDAKSSTVLTASR